MAYPKVLAQLSPAARLAFFYFYERSDEGGLIEVPMDEIAKGIKRSRQAVSLALKRLEAVNLLQVEHRRGRGKANIYVLNWAKKCKPLNNLQSNVSRDNTNLSDRLEGPGWGGSAPKAARRRPSSPQERAEELRKVNDGAILVKEGQYYRWVMEQFRLLTWHGGASRVESDLIGDTIGRLIAGRPLGFARQLAVWLIKHIRELLRELRRAIVAGIRAAYRAVNLLILRAMGLLKFALDCLKPKPRALTRRWAYNLNDRQERAAFLKRARAIANAGGGPCPRCGERIERRLLEVDSGIAFEEKGLCRCIYIALDRALREREARLGISSQEDERELIYAQRMAERSAEAGSR